MYAVNGSLTAVDGKVEELKGYLLDASKHMNDVENCYCYLVGENEDDPNSVYIVEIWEDKTAHEASLQLDVFRDLIEKAKPIIAEMDNFPTVNVIGGKLIGR